MGISYTVSKHRVGRARKYGYSSRVKMGGFTHTTRSTRPRHATGPIKCGGPSFFLFFLSRDHCSTAQLQMRLHRFLLGAHSQRDIVISKPVFFILVFTIALRDEFPLTQIGIPYV